MNFLKKKRGNFLLILCLFLISNTCFSEIHFMTLCDMPEGEASDADDSMPAGWKKCEAFRNIHVGAGVAFRSKKMDVLMGSTLEATIINQELSFNVSEYIKNKIIESAKNREIYFHDVINILSKSDKKRLTKKSYIGLDFYIDVFERNSESGLVITAIDYDGSGHLKTDNGPLKLAVFFYEYSNGEVDSAIYRSVDMAIEEFFKGL